MVQRDESFHPTWIETHFYKIEQKVVIFASEYPVDVKLF